MVEKQEDSISVEKNQNILSVKITNPVQFDLPDTTNNRKVLYVLLRLLKTGNGRNLVTFRTISALFGLNSRQDSNNYFREFHACGLDFLKYLQRKSKLGEAFPLVEKQVLEMPLFTIREQFEIFSNNHSEHKMSFASFKKYYNRIDAQKIKNRYDELITKQECRLDKERFLKEILAEDMFSNKTRKKIVSIFPELEENEKEVHNETVFHQDMKAFGKYFLIMFLVAGGMNFEMLSILFGISKATVHNWFYKLSFLKRLIIDSIKWWSGTISVDEKWVKINSKWHYLLTIVDNVTGFPLYFALVSDLKADTWKIFFQRFYKLYGKPKLIISDGSTALAGGLRSVFASVPHQLCKFHKLKNLNRRIYLNVYDPKLRARMLLLAKGIFGNSTYFGRKRAAIKLMGIDCSKVSNYVRNNILGDWSKLTKGYTSNASERWNRKIEKVISGRYGLKSEKFVEQLITGLWLKEIIKDNRHLGKCFITQINIAKKCQENVNMCNIIEFVKHNLLKMVA